MSGAGGSRSAANGSSAARALHGRLAGATDQLADAVVAEVRASDAVRLADAATLENLHLGARVAVASFLACIDPAARDGGRSVRELADRELFVGHGRAQQQAGRSLAELLSFYRLGGLAMWRVVCAMPETQQLGGGELASTTQDMLAFVDALSIAATEGFEDERARRRRAEVERRQRLHELLLAREPPSLETLRSAADESGWQLPERVRVAVAKPPRQAPANALPTIPSRVVAGTIEDGRRTLVVADEPDCEDWLLRAARTLALVSPLAVGPAVDVRSGATSARLAARMLEHIAPRVKPATLLRCDDHQVELLLTADAGLAAAIAERELAPIDALTPARRARALQTLAAWLAHPRQPLAIAGELGIHVQTVRYRLRQLNELLGSALDDADARFRLALALRARSLTDG